MQRPPILGRQTGRLSLAALAALVMACSPAPCPCVSGTECRTGEECLANTCALLGSEPVAPATDRLVLRPIAMSIVGARLDSPDAAVPTGVALGSHGVGPISWYLRFGARWNTIGRIDRALLTLSPLPGAPVGQHDVPVDAWRVTEQWSADELAWLDQPDAALPHARGIARGAPAQDLRLDVTELAAFWQAHGHENHGLVLRTGSRKGLGVTFATGAAAARGPELELYVAREQ